MSRGLQFRKWAAQVARQAGEEPDAAESQRLLSIAEYWVRRADSMKIRDLAFTEQCVKPADVRRSCNE